MIRTDKNSRTHRADKLDGQPRALATQGDSSPEPKSEHPQRSMGLADGSEKIVTQSSHDPIEQLEARRTLIALAAMFALLALPFLLWPLLPHPDERRYSIAAALMQEGGNWLVPISEKSEIRLKKPPLTYWYLLPGFALFGQTLAGAKALFLASALGIIGISYALARALGVAPRPALIAPATVAVHGIFFTTATQHIPDMPLVLGLSMALWGAVRLLRADHPGGWAWAALWLGLAYAVLAKGLLPLLLACLVLGMLARPQTAGTQRPQGALGAAIGWGCFATGIASAWFVWVGVTYPGELMRDFIGDQVTGKAGFDPWQVLEGIGKTASDLMLPALPVMTALLLARWRHRRAVADQGPRRAETLLWLWCGLVVIVFAFSTQLYERYILPALPAFAALMALWASWLKTGALAWGVRCAVRIWLWLPVLASLLGALIAWRFGSHGLALLTLGATLLLGCALWRGAAQFPLALVALAAVAPLTELARLPVFAAIVQPSAGQIARSVEAHDPGAEHRLVLDDPKLVDEIGLLTGGLTRLQFRDGFDPVRDLEVTIIYFMQPVHLGPLQASGFRVTDHAILRDLDLKLPEIMEALAHGQRMRLAADHGETLFVAIRALE